MKKKQSRKQRDDEMWNGILNRRRQRDESERRCLHAILEEHKREDPRETMLTLAWTIHELRSNFAKLGGTIDDVLEGKGFIGLWRYGPYNKQHVRRLTSVAPDHPL